MNSATKSPAFAAQGGSQHNFSNNVSKLSVSLGRRNKFRLPAAGIPLNAIAENLLGQVDWFAKVSGYCRCPGVQLHTNSNGQRDCRVMLDRVPTIHCLHSSCHAEVEKANRELRSAIGKLKLNAAQPATRHQQPSAVDLKNQCDREAYQRLKLRAERSLAAILREFATDPAEFFEESPVHLLDAPADDWRRLLQLFKPDDVLWIGNKQDSGLRHGHCFRTATEWLKQRHAPGPLICPNTLKAGACSRSNENVKDHAYLVIESDTLTKAEICAVISWCRQFLRLRAIVDTAGKSLHGWFNYPSTAQLYELKTILPKLGCDPALFTPSQPVRLPGAHRNDKIQSLLYLAP